MIRNINQCLADLDKHASEFNFPVLDNAYVEFGAARLSAFYSERDWLVVFEVLGFSSREAAFVDDIYAFGSCLELEGFVAEEAPLSSLPVQPLFDLETNQFVASWDRWSIQIRDKIVSLSPTREEYEAAGIVLDCKPGRGTFREIDLLRFLIHKIGSERLFLSDAMLVSLFPKCSKMTKLVQTTDWRHPDVARGERPSEAASITSLLEALFDRNPSLFNPGVPNTHWRNWTQLEGR